MEKVNINQVKQISIVAHRNLYIRSWNQENVEIRYPRKDKIEIEQNGSEVEIDSKLDCLISAPKETVLLVENVRENLRISGTFTNIAIEYVGGNLEIAALETGEIEQVGGNLKVGEVINSITIEKVGGNFSLMKNSGTIQCEKIGGNFYANGMAGGLDCSVGGNILLSNTNFAGLPTSLKAGGNIKISYSGTPNFYLEAKSGGGYQIALGKDTIKGIYRTLEHTFGNGGTEVNLRAGGSIKINAKFPEAQPEIEFINSDDKSWDELEQKINTKLDHDIDFTIPDLDFMGGQFEDEIEMKTQMIESRIQNAMEKLDKKFKNNLDVFTNLGINQKVQTLENATKPAKNPVSEEEKMMILRMLQEKKITAEEAEKLLNALEQS